MRKIIYPFLAIVLFSCDDSEYTAIVDNDFEITTALDNSTIQVNGEADIILNVTDKTGEGILANVRAYIKEGEADITKSGSIVSNKTEKIDFNNISSINYKVIPTSKLNIKVCIEVEDIVTSIKKETCENIQVFENILIVQVSDYPDSIALGNSLEFLINVESVNGDNKIAFEKIDGEGIINDGNKEIFTNIDYDIDGQRQYTITPSTIGLYAVRYKITNDGLVKDGIISFYVYELSSSQEIRFDLTGVNQIDVNDTVEIELNIISGENLKLNITNLDNLIADLNGEPFTTEMGISGNNTVRLSNGNGTYLLDFIITDGENTAAKNYVIEFVNLSPVINDASVTLNETTTGKFKYIINISDLIEVTVIEELHVKINDFQTKFNFIEGQDEYFILKVNKDFNIDDPWEIFVIDVDGYESNLFTGVIN